MRIDILTIFPQMFESPFSESIIKRAKEKSAVEIFLHDIRAFANDKHNSVDDSPYGGGAGMVMKAPVVVAAVESVPRTEKCQRIFLSPVGEPYSQRIAQELSGLDQIILICGRYEGIDERAIELATDRQISIGDYVLSGGEIPAMVVADSVIRLLPNVLGNEESPQKESFSEGLLEHPHYTKPREFREISVPEVLLNGNHAEIEVWRHKKALEATFRKRPDLLEKVPLSDADKKYISSLKLLEKPAK